MAKKKRTAETAVSELIDIKDVFGTPKGLDVLYGLCKRFHYFQSSYQGDVNDCLYREGERNVMNFIMSELQQDPVRLLEEFRNRQQQEVDYE